MTPARLALLDRDGTLIVERGYLSYPDGVELLPGAAAGLSALRRQGFALVVVTNQSGINRGYFDAASLEAIHCRLRALLAAEGVSLDGIYVCPHLPDQGCICRKPRPGLVEQALRDLDLPAYAAIAIGDKACDIDVGRAVGAKTFLVRTGYGAQTAASAGATPDHIVSDLREVARLTANEL